MSLEHMDGMGQRNYIYKLKEWRNILLVSMYNVIGRRKDPHIKGWKTVAGRV
jgi:hypothetical protein